MKARLFFLIGIFAFVTAAAYSQRAGIQSMTIDEFMAEYGRLEDQLTLLPVKQQDVESVWRKEEQKEIKKMNKTAAVNMKVVDEIKRATAEVLEKDASSSVYANLSSAVKNTKTSAAFLYVALHEEKSSYKGEWCIDGKGNILVVINGRYGGYILAEGPKMEEYTGCKWFYVKTSSNGTAVNDKGKLKDKDMEKGSEFNKGLDKFLSEMRSIRQSHFSVVRSREIDSQIR